MSPTASEQVWQPPALGELLRWGLPAQNTLDAWVVRALALLARQQVLTVSGLDHIRAVHDPFIVAINHSTRTESLLVPALMVLHRGGRLVHFFADWNFRLVPGIGLIYRRAQTITVTRKSAKPAFLNVLKPFYMKPPGALNSARLYLETGRSVGIFPEGTVNRDPARLLPGHRGAAYLSLATGTPVIPIGIRFPEAAGRMATMPAWRSRSGHHSLRHGRTAAGRHAPTSPDGTRPSWARSAVSPARLGVPTPRKHVPQKWKPVLRTRTCSRKLEISHEHIEPGAGAAGDR
jgi:Acyltransferase